MALATIVQPIRIPTLVPGWTFSSLTNALTNTTSRSAALGRVKFLDGTSGSKSLVAIHVQGGTNNTNAGNTLVFERQGVTTDAQMERIPDGIVGQTATVAGPSIMVSRAWYRVVFDSPADVASGELVSFLIQLSAFASGSISFGVTDGLEYYRDTDEGLVTSTNSGTTYSGSTQRFALTLEFSDGSYGILGTGIPNALSTIDPTYNNTATGDGGAVGRERCTQFTVSERVLATRIGALVFGSGSTAPAWRIRLYEDAVVIVEQTQLETDPITQRTGGRWRWLTLPAAFAFETGRTYRLAVDATSATSVFQPSFNVPVAATNYSFAMFGVTGFTLATNSRSADGNPWGTADDKRFYYLAIEVPVSALIPTPLPGQHILF